MEVPAKQNSLKRLLIWGISWVVVPQAAGLVITVCGMVRAHVVLGQASGPEKSQKLAAAIGIVMHAMVFGFLLSLVGWVLLVICLVKYLARKREDEARNAA